MSRLPHYLASTVIVVVFVLGKSVILAWAVKNRSYTGKTHLHGFKYLNLFLVHAGGLCLCRRGFQPPILDNLPAASDVVEIWLN